MDLFAVPKITSSRRADGVVLLESEDPLRAGAVAVPQWLRHWAEVDPDHPLIAERDAGGAWRQRTYGEVFRASRAIGQALLDRGLGAEHPLVVLSGNSVGHLVVLLGALTVGVPVVPVSVAYSLQSKDHARIAMIGELVRPGAVFVEDVGDAEPFAPAIAALGGDPVVLTGSVLADLEATEPGPAVDAAQDRITGDTVAKLLFTSGSTGTPKGVVTTHRMLCANQQMIRQVWPFLERERPVLVDWLPWSHTFGGNHNLNLVLANGGTLYIDEGRPAPALFAKTLANLRDVSPTIAFNVPAGYAQLVPALENDRDLAERFFARVRLIFNAAAALPEALRTRLEVLGQQVTGRTIPITGSWGTTETAPAATSAHYDFTDARCIGVPLPGVTIKLVPTQDDVYEIRVQGPSVSPGYHRRPDLAAFDDEGFYRPGDAVSLAGPDPAAGLLFRGRTAEDFKLTTGTFVHVGAMRTALLSAAPVLADAVVVGENRDVVTALAWLNPAEATRAFGSPPPADGDTVWSPQLAGHLGAALAELNAGAGSASQVVRLLVMAAPADLDAGEITDKGYVNQRRVQQNRAALVDLLYSDPCPARVITPAKLNS